MDVPTPAPSPSAAIASPAPAPTLLPLTYIVTPQPAVPGQPAITQIALSDRVVRSGAPYLVIVTTTPDVSGVTVEAYGTRLALFAAGTGRFGVMGTTPTIPWLLANRTVTVHVVATTADGRTYETALDVRVGH
jgi:hypothetical protein